MYTDRQVPVTFCDSVYAYYIYIYIYKQEGFFLTNSYHILKILYPLTYTDVYSKTWYACLASNGGQGSVRPGEHGSTESLRLWENFLQECTSPHSLQIHVVSEHEKSLLTRYLMGHAAILLLKSLVLRGPQQRGTWPDILEADCSRRPVACVIGSKLEFETWNLAERNSNHQWHRLEIGIAKTALCTGKEIRCLMNHWNLK